jgi:hypothetical protein
MSLKGLLYNMWSYKIDAPIHDYERFSPLKILLVTLRILQQIDSKLLKTKIIHNSIEDNSFLISHHTLDVSLECFHFS